MPTNKFTKNDAGTECGLCKATNSITIKHTICNRGLGPKDTFHIARCSSCEMHFTIPRLSLNEVQKFYTDDYYSYQHPDLRKPKKTEMIFLHFFLNYKHLFVEPWRRLLKPIYALLWLRKKVLSKDLKYIPFIGAGRILEIGCGSGSELLYLKELGWDVYGLEISEKAVKTAQKDLGLKNIYLGSLENHPFKTNFFDVILIQHTMEHFPDPLFALKEINKLLKTGGVLIGALPNCKSGEAKIFSKYWLHWDVPRHYSHFNPNTLAHILKKSAFSVDKLKQVRDTSGWKESFSIYLSEMHNHSIKNNFLLDKLFKILTLFQALLQRSGVMYFQASKNN